MIQTILWILIGLLVLLAFISLVDWITEGDPAYLVLALFAVCCATLTGLAVQEKYHNHKPKVVDSPIHKELWVKFTDSGVWITPDTPKTPHYEEVHEVFYRKIQ